MLGFFAIIGVVWILYNLIKEAAEPTQTGHFNWDRANQDYLNGASQKERKKRLEHGYYHDPK